MHCELNSRSNFDVAIVGGGPAGSAAAIALRRNGWRVLMVESSSYDRFRVGETAPPALRQALRTLGVWQAFELDGHFRSGGNCSAWGGPDLQYHDAVFSIAGGGWHLNRTRFDATLAREAQARGAEVRTATKLIGLKREGAGWRLDLDCGGVSQSIEAQFVIDASGRSAQVARLCGAKIEFTDRLASVFALCEPCGSERDSPPGHTLVESVEYGWWYAARLPDNRSIVNLMTDSDLVRRLSLNEREVWRELLFKTRHVREFAAVSDARLPLTVRNARSHCLDRVAGDGWTAVGDAACSFDPLSSAGILWALGTGREGGAAVEKYLSGDCDALSTYDREIHRRFQRYLAEWRAYYGIERRWSSSLFWSRRTGVVAPPEKRQAA